MKLTHKQLEGLSSTILTDPRVLAAGRRAAKALEALVPSLKDPLSLPLEHKRRLARYMDVDRQRDRVLIAVTIERGCLPWRYREPQVLRMLTTRYREVSRRLGLPVQPQGRRRRGLKR